MTQWYVIRASGLVALALLSFAVVLGLINRSRLATYRWPRFVIDRLHRNVALFTVVFVALHVVTGVTDSFVSIDLVDAIVPFHHSYSPFWVGLGSVASDLLLALVVSSLVRVRLGFKAWRAIHWLAYACWPLAVAHGVGLGTDSGEPWMIATVAVCITSVIAALAARLRNPVLGELVV